MLQASYKSNTSLWLILTPSLFMEQVYKLIVFGQTMYVNTQITSHRYSLTSDILLNCEGKCDNLWAVVVSCSVWFFQRHKKLRKESLKIVLLPTHGLYVLYLIHIDPERHCTAHYFCLVVHHWCQLMVVLHLFVNLQLNFHTQSHFDCAGICRGIQWYLQTPLPEDPVCS